MELASAKVIGDVLATNAALYPDKIAFMSQGGGERSFGAFNDRVNQLNHAVAALGADKGDRVAILARNCIEYMEVYGLGKSGLIVVALNWRLQAAELLTLIKHSAPRVLFADQRHAALIDTLRDELPGICCFVLIGADSAGDDGRVGWQSYEQMLRGSSTAEPRVAVSADDVVAVIYTSGTTGAAKGVAVTHKSVLDNGQTIAAELLGLSPDDAVLSVMPLFHSGGMWYHAFPSHALGCTVTLLPEFDPEIVLATLQSHRITQVHFVPTMIAALLHHPRIAATDLSALRSIFYAASSMPISLLLESMAVFPGCDFVQSYGSTEGGVLTKLTAADHLRARTKAHLLGSCGRAFSGREIRILDDAGVAQPPRALGEIAVRSPGIMRDYWGDEAATRRAVNGGWLRMGDVGYIDDDYVYIVDRKNDMIVTGGENVYPSEVESVLYHHPAVLEAAVFGVPDAQWVERVVAAVVLTGDGAATQESLVSHVRTQLAGYKCPKQVFLVSSLPKSGVGKVLRKQLRLQYGDGT